MIIKKTALNGILFALVFALSACGGGSGGGDGEGEGDDNGFQPFTESIPDDTLDADGAGEDEEPEDNGPAAPQFCLLYTSPSPRDLSTSRMPSSA